MKKPVPSSRGDARMAFRVRRAEIAIAIEAGETGLKIWLRMFGRTEPPTMGYRYFNKLVVREITGEKYVAGAPVPLRQDRNTQNAERVLTGAAPSNKPQEAAPSPPELSALADPAPPALISNDVKDIPNEQTIGPTSRNRWKRSAAEADALIDGTWKPPPKRGPLDSSR